MLAAAISLLAAIGASAALLIAIRFCERRRSTLARASGELERFYDAAQRLLKDPTLPPAVAAFVERFSEAAMNDRLAAKMASDVLSGAFFERDIPERERGNFAKFQAEMESLRADQKSAFAEAIAFGLLVSAASSVFHGERIRHLVLFGMFHSRRHEAPECTASPQQAVDVALEIAEGFGARYNWSPAPVYAAAS